MKLGSHVNKKSKHFHGTVLDPSRDEMGICLCTAESQKLLVLHMASPKDPRASVGILTDTSL